MKLQTNLNSVLFLLFLLISCNAFAQLDVIVKNNGEEMKGKILKIDDNNVQFVYDKETIEYTVHKSDISKITFASGRVENYSKPTFANNATADHRNKVAVLPFGYIKDQETSNTIMTQKIQQETYSIFKNNTMTYKFQDPSETNALLIKAGVDANTIQGFTMVELCNILNVEYVVTGLVSIEKTNVTNFEGGGSTTKSSGKVNDQKTTGSGKSSTFGSTYGTTTQNYSTNLTMNVYSDKGENLFSQNHSSFWQTQDAYQKTLEYLAKRTPFYKK